MLELSNWWFVAKYNYNWKLCYLTIAIQFLFGMNKWNCSLTAVSSILVPVRFLNHPNKLKMHWWNVINCNLPDPF